MIRQKQIELVTSYVLDFENSNNRSIQKMAAIKKFMADYATLYVSNKSEEKIVRLAESITCLVDNLGVIDAEYFISLIKRDDFDYTVWQREYFDKMESGEFGSKASVYANSHPYAGSAQIL